MSKKIFVSHAVTDKKIVDALIDLLQTGANISTSDIFCSSLEGLGIPNGSNFIDFIKSQLEEPKVVILLLSENYYNSQFCLCELGATWMLSNNILPLIIEPLTYDDIKGVLTGIHVNKINEKNDLNNFITILNKYIENQNFIFPRWEVKRDNFLENIVETMSKLLKPKIVSQKEFQKVLTYYESSKVEIKRMLNEINKYQQQIKDLSQLKNIDEVRSILQKGMKEKEQYDILVQKIKNVLDRNDSIVNYALYKYYIGEDIVINNYFEQKNLADDAKEAADDDFLENDDNIYTLNMDDPDIENSLSCLNELKIFIKNISLELMEMLTKEYGFRVKLENARYWKVVLDAKFNY